MIHYILQTIAFQLLFLLVYDLFLKKETFFNWNRSYLLLTPILSFILPLIKIDVIQQNVPLAYRIQLPEVLIDTDTQYIWLPEVFINVTKDSTPFLSMSTLLQYIWCIGMVAGGLLFLYKISSIHKLRKKGIRTKINQLNLISLPGTNTAFSFFNIVFLGDQLSEQKKAHILLHEKVHVAERHSIDLIFFEILRVICWFNPLIYVYQNRMTVLQEYIADARAITETDTKVYYQELLSQVFQTDSISFINTFFNHSLIKKRIVMLQKSKSKKIFQLKYLLLFPIVSSMLVYTSCTQDANAQAEDLIKSELIKRIDAVKQQIEIQGNVSPEEEEALKKLALLVSDDFSNPTYKNVVGKVDLPFGTIENVPVFPGCENLNEQESKNCFVEKITRHVSQEFNTGLGNDLGLNGQQRIYVRFKIDNTGNIVGVQARGPMKELETEAKRVINTLPKMEPGKQDGVSVGVLYSLPIVFEVK